MRLEGPQATNEDYISEQKHKNVFVCVLKLCNEIVDMAGNI